MAEQNLVTIMEEHLAAYATQDWERFRAAFAPDAVFFQAPTGQRVQGPDQIVEAVKGWKQAFPDLKATPTTILVCGNTVVAEVTWIGTHTGPFVGPLGTIPASGKEGTVAGVLVTTVEGGKIKEHHSYFDLLTILRQIGALPTPASVG